VPSCVRMRARVCVSAWGECLGSGWADGPLLEEELRRVIAYRVEERILREERGDVVHALHDCTVACDAQHLKAHHRRHFCSPQQRNRECSTPEWKRAGAQRPALHFWARSDAAMQRCRSACNGAHKHAPGRPLAHLCWRAQREPRHSRPTDRTDRDRATLRDWIGTAVIRWGRKARPAFSLTCPSIAFPCKSRATWNARNSGSTGSAPASERSDPTGRRVLLWQRCCYERQSTSPVLTHGCAHGELTVAACAAGRLTRLQPCRSAATCCMAIMPYTPRRSPGVSARQLCYVMRSGTTPDRATGAVCARCWRLAQLLPTGPISCRLSGTHAPAAIFATRPSVRNAVRHFVRLDRSHSSPFTCAPPADSFSISRAIHRPSIFVALSSAQPMELAYPAFAR
jgi:hypothetical protein